MDYKYSMNTVYLITGACGCGKSTLSKMLMKELRNTILITGDELHEIFGGKRDIEWLDRLRITWENIISVAQNSLRNQLNVIIDYVVEDELPLLLEGLKAFEYELRYMVLVTDEDNIRLRITKRGDVDMIDRALFLNKKLGNEPLNEMYLYDNTDRAIEEELDAIIHNEKYKYRM